MPSAVAPTTKDVDEPPPFLGTWRRVYFWLLSYLLVMIVGLYLVSRLFAY